MSTNIHVSTLSYELPGGSVIKHPPASAEKVVPTPGLGRSPQKEMATPSSILAWKNPMGVEEPGRLESMVYSQRVKQDFASKETMISHHIQFVRFSYTYSFCSAL